MQTVRRIANIINSLQKSQELQDRKECGGRFTICWGYSGDLGLTCDYDTCHISVSSNVLFLDRFFGFDSSSFILIGRLD